MWGYIIIGIIILVIIYVLVMYNNFAKLDIRVGTIIEVKYFV